MGHLILYNVKVLLRNRSLVFFTLAFPIILGVLFKVALGDIVNKEAFDTVPVAVVNSQVYKDSAFKIAFDELAKTGDSSVTGSDKPLLQVTEVSDLDAGKKLLQNEKVDGIVEITGTPDEGMVKDAQAKLTITTNGLNQTILKVILDEITQRVDMISTLTEREITAQLAAATPPATDIAGPSNPSGPPAFNPEKIAKSVQDQLSSSGFTLQDRSPKSMDLLMAEFFSLMAMAALYGGMFSLTIMNNVQPPLGVIGRRIAVAPTSKSKLIISGIITSYLVELVGLLALLVLCHFLFQVDFGSNWGLTMLLTSVGALAGLSFGAAISTLVPGGENAKIGVLIAVTMLGAMLAGMMGGAMRYAVDFHFPMVNKFNPVALITDGYYNLFFHPGYDGYWQDVVILLVISAVLLGASVIVLRRQRYDSL
ncbi:ABC transporter permease [uncultured Mobiluncus sp.]|uniref:ABC transporter permease n=1 Tax=uncultured Mobiluncus sp. TaxID=293425 RepID=UPI0026371086|nr:ABC transporter permease [uncultured Mobiluncus sp.]